MISISEAVRLVQENLPERRTEEISLGMALDRVLAEPVVAPEPAPRYTNSAMDGFAVRWEDVEPAARGEPVELRILGESRAGQPYNGPVGPGETVRISTGAMLPDGVDTVVPVEDAEVAGGTARIRRAERKGRHVRYAGEDIAEGTELFDAGTILTPNRIAVLAALGIGRVRVFVRPRVALIVTGSELVSIGKDPKPWQIRDSNGIMLETTFRKLGADVVERRSVEDDPDALTQAVGRAAEQADVVVLTGGVSVGPHDHVKPSAEGAGFREVFWRVRQKPGKPLFFAAKEGCRLFGLPGNPISAFVCSLYYVAPVVRWLNGLEFGWNALRGQLAERAVNRSDRPAFLQGTFRHSAGGCIEVSPSAKQGSHILSSIAHSNCFFLVEAKSELAAGQQVEVIPYPWS